MALCISDKAIGVTAVPCLCTLCCELGTVLECGVGERDKLLGPCGATYRDQQPASVASFQCLFQ